MSVFCDNVMYQDLHDLLDEVFPEFDSRNLSKLPLAKQFNRNFNQLNQNNKALNFVTQDEQLPYLELGYEERIYQQGIIAHRENNWHDFFNALIWKKFPKTKTALNSIHFHEIQSQSSNLRSKKRDILTLFDECGVLLQANESILELVRQHQWQALFVENKYLWQNQEIKVSTFGHAMYEKYLNPYIGMTAKALLLPLGIENLDNYLSEKILGGEILAEKSELSPLPMLGIPNWHKKQTHEFYANKNYFR